MYCLDWFEVMCCVYFRSFHSCPADIGPSLLACDLSSMASESIRVLEAGADSLHIDVMDGHFVPNITFGAPVIKCLRKSVPNAIFDVHLMVTNPEKWIDDMADAGTNRFTFHIEVSEFGVDILETIALAKRRGMLVGLALKPDTPVESVFPFMEHLNHVLIMTVEPGFGGQSFRENMMAKVAALRMAYPSMHLQVDGGLSPSTIQAAATAGTSNARMMIHVVYCRCRGCDGINLDGPILFELRTCCSRLAVPCTHICQLLLLLLIFIAYFSCQVQT